MYPTQCRLSIARRGMQLAHRESKSIPLPVDILDLSIPRDTRTQKLIKLFDSVLRKMIGSKPFELTMCARAKLDD